MTVSDFNFDSLPEVVPATAAATASRLPRFEGDSSELPNQGCWALQNLLARRYISKDSHPDLWGWTIDYRRGLAARLSELDLRLRIDENLEVAYVEQAVVAETASNRSRKLLRREPMSTYSSILALQLARLALKSGTEQLIGREDIHEMFSDVRHKKDRDEAMFRSRIDEAIKKMEKVKILLPSLDDPDSFSISPVIMAIMTGQRIEELTREFDRLRASASDISEDDDDSAEELDSDDDIAADYDDIENGNDDDQ